MVGQARSDVVGMVFGVAEHCGDVVVVQLILDLVALAPYGPDDAAIPNQSKMVRHR